MHGNIGRRRFKWLSDEQKSECIKLRGVDGLSIIEIAKRVGVAKSTVFSLVRNVTPPPSGLVLIPRKIRGEMAWKSRRYAPRAALASFSDLSSFQKGKLAELYFEGECIRKNLEILKPPMPDSRYDYVVLVGKTYKRIQVKWSDGRAAEKFGVITIGLTKPRGNRRSLRSNRVAVYDKLEVDFIVAYLPVLERFVILGPEIFHRRTAISLRLDDPRNNQQKNIKYAKDFIWVNQLS